MNLWKWVNSHDKNIIEGQPSSSKKYDYVVGQDLVGISTFVFANTKIVDRISNISSFEIKTGFKGSLGNKGSIILFMNINSTPITFLNCHLAAGESKTNERIQDIDYIHQEAIQDRALRKYFDRSEFRFFIGDCNFRLLHKNESVREILSDI